MCSNEQQDLTCLYYVSQECRAGCSGSLRRELSCDGSSWSSRTEKLLCHCDLLGELGECTNQTLESESKDSPSDRCDAHFICASGTYAVSCDGQNDGTLTSRCSCFKDGHQVSALSEQAFEGEAPESCVRALAACTSD